MFLKPMNKALRSSSTSFSAPSKKPERPEVAILRSRQDQPSVFPGAESPTRTPYECKERQVWNMQRSNWDLWQFGPLLLPEARKSAHKLLKMRSAKYEFALFSEFLACFGNAIQKLTGNFIRHHTFHTFSEDWNLETRLVNPLESQSVISRAVFVVILFFTRSSFEKRDIALFTIILGSVWSHKRTDLDFGQLDNVYNIQSFSL